MKGSILFSLGLMMLLLALSCDSAPRSNPVFGWSHHGPSHHGPSHHGPSHHGPPHHGSSHHGPSHHGPSHHGPSHHGPSHHGSSHHGEMWSPWSSWGACTRSCGGGTRTRTRNCRRWNFCSGSRSQTQSCNKVNCPINCPSSDCQEDGVRIRKEFISMTTAERKRYVNAAKKASTDPCYKTDLEALLTMHRILFPTAIHEKIFFLPWHRWFVLQYENILRRVDCGITVPFWDWSSDNPFDTSSDGVWSSSNSGFGGNGAGESFCVQTGPFRADVWSLVPPDCNLTVNKCLARNFSTTPNAAEVQEVLDIPVINFTYFEVGLRINLHDVVHVGVGGTMASLNAAAAPEFFLHHAMVDRLWDEWQKKSNLHKNAFFLSVNESMLGTCNLLPRELIDLSSQPGGVKVEYQRNTVNDRKGQRLRKKPGIPRELDPKMIKLFNISPAEVEMANKMRKEILVREMSQTRRRGLDPKIVKLFHVSPAEV